MVRTYRDRQHAGRELAQALGRDRGRFEALILALPRGGVPVGFEVAEHLGVPLDVLLVRKLGVPGREELAMGAIASGGARVLNEDVVHALSLQPEIIDAVDALERKELARREQEYRGDRPAPDLRGRTVILVDDGLATGATMRVAAAAVRQQQPRWIVVAVPVAPRETIDALRGEVDEVVCPLVPSPFYGVGQWYDDFGQTSDDEVRELLGRAHESTGARR